MSENFDIEAVLKEQLSKGKLTPPSGLFNKMEATILAKEKRKKRILFWWWGSAVIALLVVGIFFLNTNLTSDKLVKEERGYTLIQKVNGANFEQLTNSDKEQLLVLNTTEVSNATKELNNTIGIENLTKKDKLQEVEVTNVGIGKLNNKGVVRDTINDGVSVTILPNLDTQNTFIDNKDSSTIAVINKDTIIGNGFIKKDSAALLYSEIGLMSEVDSTLVVTPLKDTNGIVTQPVETDTALTIAVQNDTVIPPNEKEEKRKIALFLNGGPMAVNAAVFKPYFSAGFNSAVTSSASGFSLSGGLVVPIKKRANLIFGLNFQQFNASFNYDLMIGQDDYFNNYQNGLLIPIDNLDNPESCNCFLAEDASLAYTINSFNFNTDFSFNALQVKKFTLAPLVGLSTAVYSRFANNAQQVISFNQDSKDSFADLSGRLGLDLYYQFSNQLSVGIRPVYSLQIINKSNFYASNLQRITLPLTLKYTFK